MSYKYYIYGLNVESEIEIEEAYKLDFDGEPDVRVVYGDMPAQVMEMYADKGQDEYCSAIAANSLFFRIPNTCEYCVEKDVITIHPFENAVNSDIKCFILGSSFGYCMILRRMVVLHGGAVSKNGKGVIVTGESGAGKSTVSDALLSDGYLFVADDVCALSDLGNKTHINMAYPQQKLCKDAALKKGYDLSQLIYIDEERDKYAIRLKDGYLKDGIDFDYLFELALSDEKEVSFRQVSGHEKLMLIMRNIFRGEGGFAYWGVPPEYMKMCLKVASSIQVYQIARPKDVDTLDEIVQFIENTVEE